MKKILFFIILLIFPSIYFASEATCIYQYEIKLEINYKYGEKLTYNHTGAGNKKFGSLKGIEVKDIVDSNGNISCPTLYAKKSISGQKQFKVDFNIEQLSGYTAVNGTLNLIVSDDKEKNQPNSNTHTCVYKKDTDSEYTLTWNGKEVSVSLIGKRYDNFCNTKITQSEWNEEMFKDGKCPSQVYDQVVSRYENLSSCKGILIVSTNTILTENDSTTEVEGSENVYDGTPNENFKDYDDGQIKPITPPDLTNKCTGGEDSLLGNPTCTSGEDCDPAFYIQVIFTVLKYIAIVILIVMSIYDFVGAVTSSDDNAIKKATTK